MKIGIVSDIHGGLRELTSALALFDEYKVDKIICAGDLVDFGKDGDAVVEKIIQLSIPCVQGNHDRQSAEKQALLKHNKERADYIKPLKSETVATLQNLPRQLRFKWEDKTILLTHATSWDSDAYIYRDSSSFLLRRVVREADADITILGHTHQPMWIEIDDRLIINAGSTSQNYYNDEGTCGILTLPDYSFELFSVESGNSVPLDKQTL